LTAPPGRHKLNQESGSLAQTEYDIPPDKQQDLSKAESTPDAAAATAEAYDVEAQATGWSGPEVVFGLVCQHILPGQSVLDLGIGTGLGSVLFRKAELKVYGMDVSPDMLDACRWKGFDDLTRHDLTQPPYPYRAKSFDHVVCVGVLSFLRDPSPVFAETARVLKSGGTFAFVTGDRTEEEDFELVVGPEYTKTDESITMYRHSGGQVAELIESVGLKLLRSLPFTCYMDRERTRILPAKCYVVQKPSTNEGSA
jgi:predicted TPR repeat methyltransferase